jgi:hypothetical protein
MCEKITSKYNEKTDITVIYNSWGRNYRSELRVSGPIKINSDDFYISVYDRSRNPGHVFINYLADKTGEYRVYRGNHLIVIQQFREGKLHGIDHTFYDNGNPADFHNYYEGVYDGLQRGWYNTGTLRFEGYYCRGVKEGLHIRWSEDSKITSFCNYIDGYKVGKRYFSNSKGKMVTDYWWPEFIMHGRWSALQISKKNFKQNVQDIICKLTEHVIPDLAKIIIGYLFTT